MIRVRVALVMALMFLAGCGGPSIPPPQNYAIVFGRVYDATSNAPVAGVTVVVDQILSGVSGSDGTYTITSVPAGQTDVAVRAPTGFGASGIAAFSVNNGDRYRLDIPLNKQP